MTGPRPSGRTLYIYFGHKFLSILSLPIPSLLVPTTHARLFLPCSATIVHSTPLPGGMVVGGIRAKIYDGKTAQSSTPPKSIYPGTTSPNMIQRRSTHTHTPDQTTRAILVMVLVPYIPTPPYKTSPPLL